MCWSFHQSVVISFAGFQILSISSIHFDLAILLGAKPSGHGPVETKIGLSYRFLLNLFTQYSVLRASTE